MYYKIIIELFELNLFLSSFVSVTSKFVKVIQREREHVTHDIEEVGHLQP